MSRSVAGIALAVTLLALGSAPAGASPNRGGARHAGSYRPLPPVSGTLHAGRRGLYGDRGYGPVRIQSPGFAGERPRSAGFRRVAGRGGFGGAGAGYRVGAGYGFGGSFAPVVYGGQGSPENAEPGYGPAGYNQAGPSVGYGYASGGYAAGSYGGGGYNAGCGGCGGGGLGFFTQGSYGGGPRVIEIPQHVTVSYARRGCGCAPSGLFGSFGGY